MHCPFDNIYWFRRVSLTIKKESKEEICTLFKSPAFNKAMLIVLLLILNVEKETLKFSAVVNTFSIEKSERLKLVC